VSRTSADLLLPILKRTNTNASFCVVGGSESSNEKTAERIGASFRSNGFDALLELMDDPSDYAEAAPTFTIVGLGTPLQEEVLARLKLIHPKGSLITCGGWIDQYAGRDQYFPPFIHALRIGWLLRIVREPRRLLRRYSTDALRFLVHGRRLVSKLNSLEGYEWTRYGLVKLSSPLGAALLDQNSLVSKPKMKRRHDL
jgi:exopolysaccharide biosynthesis WecB/TagA/CpsF family protein